MILFWFHRSEASRAEFDKVYDILGVQLKETGESFYNPMIPGVIEELQSLGMIKDENGITILENYYSDQEKYAFQFQMMAYITRLKKLRDALSENYDIIKWTQQSATGSGGQVFSEVVSC